MNSSNPQASNPPTSNPPTSNPPASNPPASNPPASNPPASNPPASNPPTSNPPTSNPPTSNPPTSNPPAPPASDPPASEASASSRRRAAAAVGLPWVPVAAPAALAGVAGVAGVVLAVLWVGVVTGGGLARVDPSVVTWLAVARPGWAVAVAVMSVIALLGSPVVMGAVLVAVAAVLAWRRRSPALLVVGATGLLVLAGADQLVKHVVARPRPPLALHAVPAAGYSFPSGHATLSAGVALLALWLVTAPVGPPRAAAAGAPDPRRRSLVGWLVVVLAGVFVVAVGASRLVLGVHYPSDVLAGWCIAVLADTAVLGGVAALAALPLGRARGPRAVATAPGQAGTPSVGEAR